MFPKSDSVQSWSPIDKMLSKQSVSQLLCDCQTWSQLCHLKTHTTQPNYTFLNTVLIFSTLFWLAQFLKMKKKRESIISCADKTRPRCQTAPFVVRQTVCMPCVMCSWSSWVTAWTRWSSLWWAGPSCVCRRSTETTSSGTCTTPCLDTPPTMWPRQSGTRLRLSACPALSVPKICQSLLLMLYSNYFHHINYFDSSQITFAITFVLSTGQTNMVRVSFGSEFLQTGQSSEYERKKAE